MEYDYQISRYKKDRRRTLHFHDSYEIFLSLTNSGNFFIRQECFPLKYGALFCLNIADIHRCFCDEELSHDRYVVHFSEKTLYYISTPNTNLVDIFRNAQVHTVIDPNLLLKLTEKLDRLLEPMSASFGADARRNIDFMDFMISIAEIVKNESGTTLSITPDFERVSHILDYIHKHISELISLESLAKEFYISKPRLGQIFKNSTGLSIGEYIINYRMQRARALLLDGLKAQEVSFAVGFNNVTHFNRTFKKRVGISPGTFAKETRKKHEEI